MGPCFVPCGTPHVRSREVDVDLQSRTVCDRCDMKKNTADCQQNHTINTKLDQLFNGNNMIYMIKGFTKVNGAQVCMIVKLVNISMNTVKQTHKVVND